MVPAVTEPERLGRYELLLRLARGGMAELFFARLTGSHDFVRIVAVKRILPHLADDPAFVAMFLNEGRIAAKLMHPNVCSVFELVEERGELALVMEYLSGVSWEALAAAAPRDARGARLACSVLAQACEGLHYAHTLRAHDGTPSSVVHRDVSPQNLFVTVAGVCQVLDFGVSKISTDPRRTATGLVKGKLPYLAPEQLRGEPVDARADLWALGAVLWEALSGQRLFDRATDFLTFQAIHEDPLPPVRGGHDLPAAWVDRVIGPVIARALQRDRTLRYAAAREFGHDLQRAAEALGGVLSHAEIADAVRGLCGDQIAARDRQIAAVLGAPGDAAPPAEPPAASATISMALRGESLVMAPRRRRWMVPAAAGAVAVVVAVLAWPAGHAASPGARGSAAVSSAPTAAPPPSTPGPTNLDTATPSAPEPRGPAATPPPRRATSTAAQPARPPATSPPRPAAPRRDRLATAAAAQPSRPGYYAVDSRPYATIYVDGAPIGDTPLFKVPLAAGPHTVRAVLADGRQRTFPIQIEADREASSVLAW
jgi:eukaryotic-like serine/threonine-protein kinase